VQSDRRYAELGQIALDQVGKVEGLLTDLLQYARPIELSVSAVPVARVLQETSNHLRAAIEAAQIRLEVDDRTQGAEMLVDEKRIEEALSNLVRNAVEAVSPGGTVILEADRPKGDDGDWVLAVKDDGPGLGETRGDDLFRPFFTTKDTGTGLGLAHARKIVELHGGSITAENREGGGAVFLIRLPAKAVSP
jgi:signal transduction histidine kinase